MRLSPAARCAARLPVSGCVWPWIWLWPSWALRPRRQNWDRKPGQARQNKHSVASSKVRCGTPCGRNNRMHGGHKCTHRLSELHDSAQAPRACFARTRFGGMEKHTQSQCLRSVLQACLAKAQSKRNDFQHCPKNGMGFDWDSLETLSPQRMGQRGGADVSFASVEGHLVSSSR